MTKHRHNIRNITARKINGRAVATATIIEENGIFQAVIRDVWNNEYVSGSNNTTLQAERKTLREMLDK